MIIFKDPRPVKILKSTVHICTLWTKYYNIRYVYVRTALLLPLFSRANFQCSPGAKKGKKGRAAILYFPLCQIFRRFFSMDLGFLTHRGRLERPVPWQLGLSGRRSLEQGPPGPLGPADGPFWWEAASESALATTPFSHYWRGFRQATFHSPEREVARHEIAETSEFVFVIDITSLLILIFQKCQSVLYVT